MNQAVWKFGLQPRVTEITMPLGAQVLTVQAQRDEPQLWALVYTEAPREQRVFLTVGTGHPFPTPDPGYGFKYVATWQMMNGSLVFHTFELVRVT